MRKRKLKVGVLMGGPSAEHEVSLASGKTVLAHLDDKKYKAIPVKITKNGKWTMEGKTTTHDKAIKSCDILFNALHGTYGEDGKIQALIEHYGARYTGSGIGASSLGMDKYQSRQIFSLVGMKTPRTMKVIKGQNNTAQINFFASKIVGFPVVIKPCSSGSSVGVGIAHSTKELADKLGEAFVYDKIALIEEYITGREFTCSVLDNGKTAEPKALEVTEIIPVQDHSFFNYKAKYTEGHAEHITPAKLDTIDYAKVQTAAAKAHSLIGCRGYSRTDMILKKGTHDIYVLEINTLPGLTPTSLLPQAAGAAGLTITQLLDHIIEASLI